jgi:hypothetical protein
MKASNNIERIVGCGISRSDAERLRKDAMILRRWYELECGIDGGGIERDEKTGKVTWYNAYTGRRSAFPDRETPALKRVAEVMGRYPSLTAFHQTDPRGCSMYILRPGDVPDGQHARSFYTSGVAVY